MLVYMAMTDLSEDQPKFEKIYHTYKGLMFFVANGILSDERDAEDAVHNAFIKIAKMIHKIKDPMCSQTRNLVVIIVERKAIDLYRANQRRARLLYAEDPSGIAGNTLPDHELAYCISQLPARYQQVIMLKYHHGFGCEEIARLLGISKVNAAKLDQRAKAKLKEICTAEGLL